MKKTGYTFLLLSFMLCYAGIAFSRQEKQQVTRQVFTAVEQMPTFPGGRDALNKYITKHLKYPKTAMKNAVEGKAVLRFIVEADGSISDVEVVRSLNAECDQEAIKVVKGMPKWDPGMQNGAFVATYYTLPITFAMH